MLFFGGYAILTQAETPIIRVLYRRLTMLKTYRSTIGACLIGYVVQAAVNNFAPLLFLTFQSTYSIALSKITALITVNFILQLTIDLISTFIVDKLGYRRSALIAHFSAAAGLIGLTILPSLLPDPFIGLLISVIFYAIGGGFIEVIISPIVESCPTKNKEKTMSFLHSFYCWGCVGVIVISSLFFTIFGIENWKIIALVWAALPIINGLLFLKVPLFPLVEEGEKQMKISEIIKNKTFLIFAAVIFCSGAAELAVEQWASTFVETSLGISKEIGDIIGPALFAVCMGLSRLIYGKFGDKISLYGMMTASGALCVISYLVLALIPYAAAALVAMALSGFSVGILWPGTYSLSARHLKGGGNAMFALLALAGDLGCTAGPSIVGFISDGFGGDLKIGILVAAIFPAALTLILLTAHRHIKKSSAPKPAAPLKPKG